MTGGPMTAGIGYLIAEKGPELFVPATSGHVIRAMTDDELGEAPSIHPDEPEPVPDVATDRVEDDPSIAHEPVERE